MESEIKVQHTSTVGVANSTFRGCFSVDFREVVKSTFSCNGYDWLRGSSEKHLK